MIDNPHLFPPDDEFAPPENPKDAAAGSMLSAMAVDPSDGEVPSQQLAEAEREEILSPEEIRLRDRREMVRALGLISQVGLTMAICVALGVIFGNTLDRILGSSPWLLIFGAFLGGGSAIKIMIEISNGTKK